jgi:hypothetical protein
MLPMILWLAFGARAAVTEILGELAIAAAIVGGGGGKRIRHSLRQLVRPLALPRLSEPRNPPTTA